ncbi:hypothetical protein IU431_06715 [Nocardia otitidiscaviarum]|nr:hypothetical protein [Nocardia otitidiscaviarum]MBF6483849.1 hypothetical protein [Nocardia otitidiscaviarum]
MMWLAIMAFALACTALIAVGAVVVLLISVSNALQTRRPATPEVARR